MSLEQFEVRLLIALVLGALIGLEREWQQRIAGIRTNALVALGSALFVLLGSKITGDTSGESRIIAQIVSGIGFLGAGTIIKDGFSISGLNTAATIWCSGAVGCLAGLGWVYEASVGAGFIVATHFILRPLGRKIDQLAEERNKEKSATSKTDHGD
jgi:putative Mg2+ transporter-C (MgtC) family protein